MATKLSISLPEATVEKIDQDVVNLRLKTPRKTIDRSKVINAHLKRSMGIALEVNL